MVIQLVSFLLMFSNGLLWIKGAKSVIGEIGDFNWLFFNVLTEDSSTIF